jgi:hypothetical protein
LQLTKAVLELLLVLGLGQLSLSDLNQLGRDCGLEEPLDEVHEFSKVNMGQDCDEQLISPNTAHSTILTISNSASR